MSPSIFLFNLCTKPTLVKQSLWANTKRIQLGPCCHTTIGLRVGIRRLTTTPQEVENTNVGHSRFLAEASKGDKWKEGPADKNPGDGSEVTSEDFDSITEGKGENAISHGVSDAHRGTV